MREKSPTVSPAFTRLLSTLPLPDSQFSSTVLVGDHVTIEVTEVTDHYGDTIVRGRYDGTYDKTNLPDELILTNYFTVRDGKIVSLIVIRNTAASY
jgi:hypothetical protein